MKKLVILILIAACIIFSSVFILGYSIANAESNLIASEPKSVPAATATPSPVSTSTPTPEITQIPCPIPTAAYLSVDFESPTDDLVPFVDVSLSLADTITITGELGVYTASSSGPIQVELIGQEANYFKVEAHRAPISMDNGCTYDGYTISEEITIVHESSVIPGLTPNYTPTLTPSSTPTNTVTPNVTPTLGCPPNTFEHNGVCYPEPWTGEQQYGCFPTVDGFTICIDPPLPGTPTVTPDVTPTPCPISTQQPVPSINEVIFDSPTGALSAIIIIDGMYLYYNVKISGPMGEYAPTTQSYDSAEFDVMLVADSRNIFTVHKRLNLGEVDPDTCNFIVDYEWVTALEIEIVQEDESVPSTPMPTPTPTLTPTLTPTSTPTPTLQSQATVVYPTLNSVDPNPVAAGGSVEIIGSGGYLYYADSGFYNESSRNFDLFFDGALVSTIGCYVNYCRTEFTLPANAISGTHEISAEGGSTIAFEVSAATDPPVPTITVNHSEGAPGSIFLIEGSGFTTEEEMQIAITGMTDAITIRTDSSGNFTLLLMTDNLASGVYELGIQPTSTDLPADDMATISLVLDESQPQRNRPSVLDGNVAEVDIAGGQVLMTDSKIFLPYLQVR